MNVDGVKLLIWIISHVIRRVQLTAQDPIHNDSDHAKLAITISCLHCNLKMVMS